MAGPASKTATAYIGKYPLNMATAEGVHIVKRNGEKFTAEELKAIGEEALKEMKARKQIAEVAVPEAK